MPQKSLKLTVEGMKCEGCVQKIQQHLYQQPGVRNVSVDLDAGVVEMDLDLDAIKFPQVPQAIQNVGFKVTAMSLH